MSSRILTLCTVLCLILPSSASAQFNIDKNQFDNWMFGGMRTEQKARSSLESRIEIEIERVAIGNKLTEQQKEKIRLAGKGDIKRFFDEVKAARQKFLDLGEVDQGKINEAHQISQQISQRFNKGILGEKSLLQKVAFRLLDETQADAVRKSRQQRRQRKIDLMVHISIAGWSRTLALTHDQRIALSDLIQEKIKIKKTDTPYAQLALTYQLENRCRKEVEKILDEQQFEAFQVTAQQANQMQAMLKQQGLIDDDDE